MVDRIQKLNNNHSLFLFGARGTGKTTLLKSHFDSSHTLWIDLLKDADEQRYGRYPDELSRILSAKKYERVIIDEIQKAPKILDVVHSEIEKHNKIQFILTGSSARKLKRGSANLLAGRAFLYYLFPFTTEELASSFDLKEVLQWGTLPGLYEYSTPEEKSRYLRSYVRNYLREEIQIEQLIRKLNPFRDFLEVAAQSNGKIINYSKIARDVGVDDKTIYNYFSILEETLVGFYLPAFHRSIRKQQREAPKFYFFDLGIVRALKNKLRVELVPKTYDFGDAFEHWLVLEVFRINEYYQLDYKISYLRTKDQVEIDLVVSRPGEPDLLLEIKSTDHVRDEDATRLKRFKVDWDEKCEVEIWSLDKNQKMFGDVRALYWREGLRKMRETK